MLADFSVLREAPACGQPVVVSRLVPEFVWSGVEVVVVAPDSRWPGRAYVGRTTTEGNGSFLRSADGAWVVLARIGEGFEIEDLLAVDEPAKAWVSLEPVA